MMTPRDREIFDRVRAFYLALPGRDEAGWEAVAADPRKFNRCWRVMLGEAPSGLPPEHVFNKPPEGDPPGVMPGCVIGQDYATSR